MKTMASHSSATTREETPHAIESTKTTISNSLRRRAQVVIHDRTIDAQSRAVIQYGLEINDPWLAELVRRVDAGEAVIDIDFSEIDENREDDKSEERVEVLAEMICRAGDEAAAALLVLMANVENAAHTKALANAAKHVAFTHCGELNLYGMVDAQIVVLESELLA
jgi:hypothetical protein